MQSAWMLLFAVAVVGGLVLLTKAADEFVAGAARLAVTLRVSAVVIGAVVIGFGTSTPELIVSGLAAGQQSVDIAVGNVVGSNVANLTLVLGTAAIVLPLAVDSQTLRREAPISTLAVFLFAALLQGPLRLVEGVLLLVGLAAALTLMLRAARTDDEEFAREVREYLEAGPAHSTKVESVRTVLGLLGTLAGAQLLVYGARGLAREAGLAEGFIGVTVVAVGTSLPELVTSLQAARRGEPDLIVGNLLGSNIFNSLGVGGLIAVVGTGPADPGLAGPATAVMVAVALLTMWFMWSGRTVHRWEGALLLLAYPLTVFLVGT